MTTDPDSIYNTNLQNSPHLDQFNMDHLSQHDVGRYNYSHDPINQFKGRTGQAYGNMSAQYAQQPPTDVVSHPTNIG